ncbi:MAG TPA: sugar phosphate isomerase/epimerase family protein [Gaiellaceae bacterium]|nr:sugar phosphate isomerase/epimerase family protein [Gaiellaceae bacterium]
MNAVGIMQGRLSPPVGGRIQAFPVDSWRKEFPRARDAGLACIEWIYELPAEERNPLSSLAGVEEIRAVADAAGISVSSVCADYYMAVRLVEIAGAVDHLVELLSRVGRLGARYVVLPFVDESRLRSPQDVAELERVLARVLPAAERHDVELHLETDLPVESLVAVLERIGHPLVRANYDTGNAAALGRPPADEIPALAPFLGSVHVKDRELGGSTVPLGTGAADLAEALRLIEEAGFAGPYILQAAREDGSDVDLARRNRALVERLLQEETSWTSS